MHNPEPILENKTYKIHWDLGIQMDQLIPDRTPYLVFNEKKNKQTCHQLGRLQSKNERK